MNQTCVLILGMHRSGTSALTGLLNLTGLSLGTHLMNPADDNPKGFFENQDIVDFNETLFEQLRTAWDDTGALSSEWYNNETLEPMYQNAQKIIEIQFKDTALFSIKDPRMCILFPFWEKVFQLLNIDVKIIIPYRNPLEVAESLHKRNEFNREKSLLLWVKHVLFAEFYSRNYARIIISYDNLLNNPKMTMASIEKALAISLPNNFESIREKVDNFLEKSLKHQNMEKIIDFPVPSFIKGSFELLEKNNLSNNIIENKILLDVYRDEYTILPNYFATNQQLEQELFETQRSLNKSLKENIIKKEELGSLKITLIETQLERTKIEQELDNIFHSKGWKLLQRLRKVKYLLILAINVFKSPWMLLRQLNKHRIKKIFYYMMRGDFSLLKNRFKQLYGHEAAGEKYELFETLMEANVQKPVLVFDYYEKPLISIVIPVYNQWEFTYRCLHSIRMNSGNISYEILIGDDQSNDKTLHIHEYVKNITLVRHDINLGFLKNCNETAKKIRGEYLVFLNNDTAVQKGWLDSLVEILSGDSNAGMVGSKLVYPSGQLQEAGGIVWNDANAWNYGRMDNPRKPAYNYLKEVDYISGAAIMIRHDLWRTIGGFDERFIPAYYEDTDLAFEVRKHGFKVIYQPRSTVVHFEGISNGTDTSTGMKRYQNINKEKFLDKWRDTLISEHFPDAVNVFSARDRSRHKKHLLWIDHYVPTFDQDAGSRATLHYLELFCMSGFCVKFLGDNFAYDRHYVEKLEAMGIEVLYGSECAIKWKKWIKLEGNALDYVVLSRPHITEKYIDIIKSNTNAKIIYTGVDLHYLREEREADISASKVKKASSKKWKVLEYDLMRKSDVSLFYSNVEIEHIYAEDASINAVQIPLFIYKDFPVIQYNHDQRHDIMFIGGFSHSPNVDAVIWYMQEIFTKISKEINAKFFIIGSNPPKEILNYAQIYENVIVTGRVSDEELESYYKKCRVAVAPLRFGAGIKGKVIEAMYHQIPLVTTNIGAEGLQGVSEALRIADDTETFANDIICLYNNAALAENYSRKSLYYCQEKFSYEAAKQAIARAGIQLN